MRFLRFITGLFLLPVIVAQGKTVAFILPGFFSASFPYVNGDVLAIFGGYFLWLILQMCCKVPDTLYIFGHELTHAMWALLTFSKVGKIKISKKGGYCEVTNPGPFITLAPYFVPFYSVIVLLLRFGIGLFTDMTPYSGWWFIILGFTYGFHLTNTIKTLYEVAQPDVLAYGRLFSYTLIAAVNLLVLEMSFVIILSLPLKDFVLSFWNNLMDVVAFIVSCAERFAA